MCSVVLSLLCAFIININGNKMLLHEQGPYALNSSQEIGIVTVNDCARFQFKVEIDTLPTSISDDIVLLQLHAVHISITSIDGNIMFGLKVDDNTQYDVVPSTGIHSNANYSLDIVHSKILFHVKINGETLVDETLENDAIQETSSITCGSAANPSNLGTINNIKVKSCDHIPNLNELQKYVEDELNAIESVAEENLNGETSSAHTAGVGLDSFKNNDDETKVVDFAPNIVLFLSLITNVILISLVCFIGCLKRKQTRIYARVSLDDKDIE